MTKHLLSILFCTLRNPVLIALMFTPCLSIRLSRVYYSI